MNKKYRKKIAKTPVVMHEKVNHICPSCKTITELRYSDFEDKIARGINIHCDFPFGDKEYQDIIKKGSIFSTKKGKSKKETVAADVTPEGDTATAEEDCVITAKPGSKKYNEAVDEETELFIDMVYMQQKRNEKRALRNLRNIQKLSMKLEEYRRDVEEFVSIENWLKLEDEPTPLKPREKSKKNGLRSLRHCKMTKYKKTEAATVVVKNQDNIKTMETVFEMGNLQRDIEELINHINNGTANDESHLREDE